MNDNELILLCQSTARFLDRIAVELERREKREQPNAAEVGWLTDPDLNRVINNYLKHEYYDLKREMEFTDWLMQPASPENKPRHPPVSRKQARPRRRGGLKKSGTRAGS